MTLRTVLTTSLAVLCFSAPAMAQDITARFVGASEERYDRPHDLVLGPEGHALFVADLGYDRVAVLQPVSLRFLGEIGAEELSSPHDVVFDVDDRLLVADTGNDRIAIYDVVAGEYRWVGELTEGLSAPEGVAVGPDGRVYVANARGNDVVVFDDGKKVASVGERGSEPGQFIRPHDIHVTPDDRVIVADPGNNRLQVFSTDLVYQDSLGGPKYDFNEPKYFDYLDSGWLVVADEYNHELKVIDPEGALVSVIGKGERGKGPYLFNQPEGVEVSGEDLWVSDTKNGRIVRYVIEGLP